MLANGAVANLSGTNTGDNATNSQYSGIVSNATHTADATGATALTVVALNGTNLAGLATGILKNTTGTGVPSIAANSDLPAMSSTVGGAVPTPPNNTTTFLRGDGTFAAAPGGTVTNVSVTTANGVSGSVATETTTPAISITLGAITPSSVVTAGSVTAASVIATTSGAGAGGTLTMNGAATSGGTINTSGSATAAGGAISTFGGAGGVGGVVNTSGSAFNGGNINTNGGASAAGGDIQTWGSAAAGGSITTSNGGGSITTNGAAGSIQLGVAATRTTINGAGATAAITMPAGTTVLAGLATTQTFTGACTFNNANVLAGAATMALFNTTCTNLNFAGAATTFTAAGAATSMTFAASTAAGTHNYSSGVLASGTKTVNLGTAGASGATTNINIGSATAGSLGTTTLQSRVALTPTLRNTGVASYLTVTTPADTNMTLSTESIGASFTAATRQWATGTLTLQRERVFAAPTYSFVGASALTTAINVDIADPIQGTNCTLTNSFGMLVNKAKFTGAVVMDTTLTGTGGVTQGVLLYASNGAITKQSGMHMLSSALRTMTLADPVVAEDGMRLVITSNGSFAHTVTFTTLMTGVAGTRTLATWPATTGSSLVVFAYNTRWFVEAVNNVTLT
jgi:hypothetical protein